ncbi:TRAP transporter small permease [Pararhodobacter sp.]|uniref:TRAP transporter small permease n=1 Tax=Pararhodobacter sp. TaxID=2127056 RepID=UPI002AFF554E|nr:TRAP transporter small permease [Pararhodobacter sp.]
MKALASFVGALDRGLRIVAALCLAGLFLLMLAQVALRYTALGVPAFAEELARYAMVWMALLATAVAVREGSHIRVDFVPLALGSAAPLLGRALEALLDALTLGICLVIFWQGLDIVSFAAGQRSDGLRIPMSWPYGAMPVAFGLAAILALARLFERRTPA